MKDTDMKKNIGLRSNSQKGAVTLLVALTLPVMLGAAALAVDLAHLHVVRNELQNDADAAALAGARTLYKNSTSSLVWSSASDAARNAITLNRAAGHALSDGQVQVGYWDLTQATSGFQALPMTPGIHDAPAVQVNVSKSDGQNQGPASTFLARIWGVNSRPVQATAVAGVTSPGSVNPAGLFPVGMSECMYQKFWNTAAQPAAPRIDSATGKPYVFKIGSLYQYANCESGQWTKLNISLQNESKGADLILKIIQHDPSLFNPPPQNLSIGDAVFMESGAKTNIYDAVNKCPTATVNPCHFVVMPVLSQVQSGTFATIRGFACLEILGADGSNLKYILVQMSSQCQSPFAGGVGPNYGVVTPPSLFR